MKTRYYFWQYVSFRKEWRQLGHMNGYSTLSECKKDNEFYIHEEYKYMIMEAKPIKIYEKH